VPAARQRVVPAVLVPPHLHLFAQALEAERLADPPQKGVVRLDEEVAAERREDALERGVRGRELVCEEETKRASD